MGGADSKYGNGTLGIDAGGTFTDLAFVRDADSAVEAAVKTPTDHGDLAATIERGLALMLEHVSAERIKAVNIATTLATNAIAEDKLRSCALFLIGYDEARVRQVEDAVGFGADHIFLVDGGHDVKGDEKAPLDQEKIVQICAAAPADIKSAAVSSYFSVRNPEHELLARELIHSLRPEMYVTCGHELATELNAIKRATTAAINAGLIPIIIELLDSVKKGFFSYGIRAPITIVRGDGSIVSLDWASTHPIETVLSGPAASAVGAAFLAGTDSRGKPSAVVDIGGTTTDIINLDENGAPLIKKEGASVGGRDTLVKAIDIFTFGLGGDSRVCLSKEGGLIIGPRRVKPLCHLAADNPTLSRQLEECLAEGKSGEPLVVFVGNKRSASDPFENKMLERLAEGPVLLESLVAREPHRSRAISLLEEMERREVLSFAGFTPTDALTVLGRLKKWRSKASFLGARMIMREDCPSPEAFCEKVCARVSHIAAKNIFLKKLRRENFDFGGNMEKVVEYAFSDISPHAPAIRLELNSALIGVGAPAWAFMGKVGELLFQKPAIPEYAEVGGAVGAAVGIFSLKYAVLISPLADGTYRGHLPLGVKNFDELEEAVDEIGSMMREWLLERAKIAGAASPHVETRREDETAWISGKAQKIYLCTYLYFNVADEDRAR